MSSISLDDVKKLGDLSALKVTDEEAVVLQKELEQILNYVAQLSEVDTEGVVPTYDVHYLHSVMRDDTVIDYGVSQDDLLKNAPARRGAQVEVPKVLDV